MQDSLEDYLRLMKNTKLPTINLNTAEKDVSWQRKQQCENYAFKIIEFMIEGKLQPQVFVKSLNFIHPEHYQDIVEERTVGKLCGYPVCGKRLPQMPKKQFHISTKQNKIYDITDRKLFCCNYCYQASEFVKKQIDTSPLWLRRPEDFQRFILLDQKETLRPGVEIDHGLAKLPTGDNHFTSVGSFTEACLDEAEEMELKRLMKEKEEEEEIAYGKKKPKSVFIERHMKTEKINIVENDEGIKPKSILKKRNSVVDEKILSRRNSDEKDESSENTEIRVLERKSVSIKGEVSEKIEYGNESIIIVNKDTDITIHKDITIDTDNKESIVASEVEISTNKVRKCEEIKDTNISDVTDDNSNCENQENETIISESLSDKHIIVLEKGDSVKSNEIRELKEGDMKEDIDVNDLENNQELIKDNHEIKKIVTVVPDFALPSTSGAKSVRFQFDPQQESEAAEIIKSTNSDKPSEEEIAELTDAMNRICKYMGIDIPQQKQQPKIPPKVEKPVKIDELKMKKVIEKINAKDASRGRKIQIIEPPKNPNESKLIIKRTTSDSILKLSATETKDNKGSMKEKCATSPTINKDLPKYATKLVDKMKPQREDPNLQRVIDKVKNMNLNKSANAPEEDKLKTILAKIKRKDDTTTKKAPILIDTAINPEIELPKKKEVIKPKDKEISSVLDRIRLCLLQWLTIETYTFIHGEAKVKSVLNAEALGGYFEKLKVAELETAKQVKYMNICKKLQLRELAEEKFDGVLLNTYQQRKPLPDYGRLKEEGKDMDQKVKAFFTGKVYEREDPNFKNAQKKDSDEEQGIESPAVLPMVDAGSQNAVRKKIFINAVSKYVQIHIKELELDETVFIEVQTMIKTFKFEADNIVFKPQMWNIIGFVLILMISRKYELVNSKLTNINADTYRELLFSKFENWKDFLQKVLHIIERVDVYVMNYIVSE